MTRLMCSHDRKEVEGLKSKLFQVGIRSEIRSNPLTNALGILRLELHIYESDFVEASRIHQEFSAAQTNDLASKAAETAGSNGPASREEVKLLAEPVRSSSAIAQIEAQSRPDQPRTGSRNSSGDDLEEAAVLLEKEVEEVLARDRQLAEQCAALQNQVKALDESLAQAKSELARQSAGRAAAEQKLAEASAARGSLEKELDCMNQRLKTAEQSLAAADGRLASKTRELKLQQAKALDLSKEVASRERQLETLAESLAQTRASLESEKGLRQVAEQNASDHDAARKSLEQQVNEFAELQAQLQDRTQREREKMQASLDTVNKLRCRLNQKRTPPQ